jgi:hypothetical protein
VRSAAFPVGFGRYFKAVSVTLPAEEKSSVAAANGILYLISGSKF